MPSFWLHPRVECRDALQWQWSDALIPGKRIRSVDVRLQHSQPGLQLQHSAVWLYCMTVWLHDCMTAAGKSGEYFLPPTTAADMRWRRHTLAIHPKICAGTTHHSHSMGCTKPMGTTIWAVFLKDECNVVDIEWLPSFFRINYAQRIASVGGGCRLTSVQN